MKEKSWRRSTVLTVLVLGALVLSACATRSVNQILADPSRYRNREVRLSGSVVESYSFADRGAYRIDDQSGQLWVVSDRGVPRKGARVTVTGTIREGFNLGTLGDRISLPAGIGTGLVMTESSHNAKN
jgi:membrane protein implicated in regulation of membrane protease activity